MNKTEVVSWLSNLRAARRKWYDARASFFSAYEQILTRLVYEGLANYMSPNEIADNLGVSVKTIRTKMRALGLDPRTGKTILNRRASEALTENAALLGIEPSEMDLTSPLAYLPMGEKMRDELRNRTVSQVHELEHRCSRLDIIEVDGEDVLRCPECGHYVTASALAAFAQSVSGNDA